LKGKEEKQVRIEVKRKLEYPDAWLQVCGWVKARYLSLFSSEQ